MVRTKPNLFSEVAGWYGVVAIISAYALVSFDIISADSLTFQLLNLSGAIGILAIAIAKKIHQPIVINIFWALIAVIAIIRLMA